MQYPAALTQATTVICDLFPEEKPTGFFSPFAKIPSRGSYLGCDYSPSVVTYGSLPPSSFIQVSDDEYEIHTNIDIASLIRWRHQARIKRMEKEKKKEAPATEGAK